MYFCIFETFFWQFFNNVHNIFFFMFSEPSVRFVVTEFGAWDVKDSNVPNVNYWSIKSVTNWSVWLAMTKKYVNTKLKIGMAIKVAAQPDGVKAMEPVLCQKSWVSVWMTFLIFALFETFFTLQKPFQTFKNVLS